MRGKGEMEVGMEVEMVMVMVAVARPDPAFKKARAGPAGHRAGRGSVSPRPAGAGPEAI